MKKVIGILLCSLMMIGILPCIAFAEEIDGNLDLSAVTGDVIITSGGYSIEGTEYLYSGDYTFSGNTTCRIVVQGYDADITLNNFSCSRPNGYTGSAIELKDGASLNLHLAEGTDNTLIGGYEGSGIRVNPGTTLIIDGKGILRAGYKKGGNYAVSAPIGGYYNSNYGTIIINDGTIYANSTTHGHYNEASIGSGNYHSYEDRGKVIAGKVILNGGIVHAERVGSGKDLAGSEVTGNGNAILYGNINATINTFNGIQNMTVVGDAILSEDFEVEPGKTLDIPAGTTLRVSKTLTNNGVVNNQGTINNLGTIQGTVTGNQPIEVMAVVSSGDVTSYYASVIEAFEDIAGKIATVTIWRDCDLGNQYVFVDAGTEVTLEMNEGVELSTQKNFAIFVSPSTTFIMNSGTVTGPKDAIYAHAANIVINGGKLIGNQDEDVANAALYLATCTPEYDGSVTLSGGTFVGGIISASSGMSHELLKDGYAYMDESGNGIKNTDVERLYGTVLVSKCISHSFDKKATSGLASEATCKKPAKYYVQCDFCNTVSDTVTVETGELNSANHENLKKVDAKAATYEQEGNIKHWYCDACDRYFADAAATEEIVSKDTIKIPVIEAPKTETLETEIPKTEELETETPKTEDLKAEVPKAESPKTGDGSNAFLWILVCVASWMVLRVEMKKRKN